MYKIEIKHYGIHITMGGLYAPGEMEKYVKDKGDALKNFENGYSLFVDLQIAIPPSPEDAELLRESQNKSSEGLIRKVIIVHSPVVRQRAAQLILSGPIRDRTRIFNSATTEDWEELAMNWILYGTEPFEEDKSLEKDTQSPVSES